VRIFKIKTLARFTRQHSVSDDSLVTAVEDAVRGLIDADLGGHIIKQRVARSGQGRRGGFRMLIGIRPDRAIFLFGFAKNEQENIDDDQLKTLRDIVASWIAADETKITQALKDGLLIEVRHGSKSKKEPRKEGP
jgi:hypothetical protein